MQLNFLHLFCAFPHRRVSFICDIVLPASLQLLDATQFKHKSKTWEAGNGFHLVWSREELKSNCCQGIQGMARACFPWGHRVPGRHLDKDDARIVTSHTVHV
jgi:hypothetical protein